MPAVTQCLLWYLAAVNVVTFTVYGIDKRKARRGAGRIPEKTLFLLPLLAILPHFLGVNGVWCSLPSADTLASLVAITVLVIFVRRFNRQAAEAKAKTQEYKIKK